MSCLSVGVYLVAEGAAPTAMLRVDKQRVGRNDLQCGQVGRLGRIDDPGLPINEDQLGALETRAILVNGFERLQVQRALDDADYLAELISQGRANGDDDVIAQVASLEDFGDKRQAVCHRHAKVLPVTDVVSVEVLNDLQKAAHV